ncbi:Ppx/GppA phosphatase [Halanaerobium praevalens DSM 2228]|uniref:Ppx/GppA phosphatase n=1 Tax=Halanaerobium praevalens (strain ATCC 33744 / DSM 2228 / GSL) TaxID=572479 RepID=E3DQ81_HALPG|nr:Ppx/GppA phosphatase [Halanaerobium praevalens DSM 2228]
MKAAAIDIGTNSCRLLIGEKNSNNSFNILVREVEITRLGEGVDENKNLNKSAVKRVEAALKKYKNIIEKYEVEKVRIIGTSALRDVNNSDLLAESIEKMGFKLEIISGEEEAELNYLGASSNLEANFLLIDIGGGSTEFIWANQNKINFKSLDIGCVRLTERFIDSPAKKVSAKEIENIKKYVENLLKSSLKLKQNFRIKGVGGTITTLAAIKLELTEYLSEKIENLEITKIELEQIISKLTELKLEKRAMIKGLQAKRADIIVAGLIILNSILDYFGSENLVVSDQDLLYGLLKEELVN